MYYETLLLRRHTEMWRDSEGVGEVKSSLRDEEQIL